MTAYIQTEHDWALHTDPNCHTLRRSTDVRLKHLAAPLPKNRKCIHCTAKDTK